MSANLIAWTALPNLHPAIVHFPLALLAVGLGFDLLCLLLRRQKWLDSATASLYLLGALGAGAAFLSGRWAEDSLSAVPPAVQPYIAAHADVAQWTLISFAIIAAARTALAWKERLSGEVRVHLIRLSLIFASGAALGLLWVTADRGGALVYRHGVAVATVTHALPHEPSGAYGLSGESRPPGAPGADGGRLKRGKNGCMVWTPLPGDRAALGRILRPVSWTAGAGVVVECIISPSGMFMRNASWPLR